MERRPDNLVEAMGIHGAQTLTEEERTMQGMLREEYKEKNRPLIEALKAYREAHPEASLGDAIRALYKAATE